MHFASVQNPLAQYQDPAKLSLSVSPAGIKFNNSGSAGSCICAGANKVFICLLIDSGRCKPGRASEEIMKRAQSQKIGPFFKVAPQHV